MKKIILIIIICIFYVNSVKAEGLGKIDVYYINTMGEYLLDTNTYQGKVGQPYNIVPPEIYGYYLVRVDGNEYGLYSEEPQEVYYMYDEEFLLPDNIYTKTSNNYKIIILLCLLAILTIIKFL